MTAVRTTPATPPPRLPVRDKAAATDRGWGGVSPMLTRLAAERATGILVRERGTLHLADGKVVHAESPAAPGADVLLAAHGTLDAEVWRQALAESIASSGSAGTGARRLTGAQAVHRAGRRLVEGGLLTPGALELCRLTALYDAAYFALAPSSTPGRFRYGTEDGPDGPPGEADAPDDAPDDTPGVPHPVPVAELERETLRRRDLLHRIWPDALPDEVPLTREHRPAPPLLPARRQAVLARVDGVRTAAEIARELGRPAFHTLVDVRRLVAAGVVSPRPPASLTQPQPGLPGLSGLSGMPAEGSPVEPVDPHITLLKRLRDALEAL
ncbi:hypothetical protein ACFYZ8_34960 [Streptomyces sp. NPDC001668]|uniref:hypothetical protein n=1 Tax=unclassified Streptomyces TaxID=2593676 RepID=UPI00367C6BB9